MYLDKETLISDTFTTDVDLGTLLLAGIDVRHDALARLSAVIFVEERGRGRTYVELDLRDLRSLIGALGEGITDLDQLDPLGELGKEFVVDSRLNKDTGASTASLAVVPATRQPD